MVILEFVLNDNKTNIVIVPSSTFKLKRKMGNMEGLTVAMEFEF